MTAKKVYAVNSGEYSDYRVNAIFSTKEKAEAFMRAVPHNDYNHIEEDEIDPPTVDLIRRGYSLWRVLMLRNGDVEEAHTRTVELYSVDDVGAHIWRRSKAPAHKGTNTPDVLESTVWAKTEQQAIKITNERRAQMIANGEWK